MHQDKIRGSKKRKFSKKLNWTKIGGISKFFRNRGILIIFFLNSRNNRYASLTWWDVPALGTWERRPQNLFAPSSVSTICPLFHAYILSQRKTSWKPSVLKTAKPTYPHWCRELEKLSLCRFFTPIAINLWHNYITCIQFNLLICLLGWPTWLAS